MIDNLLRYLDLQSENRQLAMVAKDKGRKSVSLPVIPQYIALVLGITLQPYLARVPRKSQLESPRLSQLANFCLNNCSYYISYRLQKNF